VLTGEAWVRNRELISRLADMELNAKIIALREAVHEAEMILDFRRITLSQAENEKLTRHTRSLRRIQLEDAIYRREHPDAPRPEPRTKKEQASVADATIKVLMKLGMTKEVAMGVILKMSQAKEGKK